MCKTLLLYRRDVQGKVIKGWPPFENIVDHKCTPVIELKFRSLTTLFVTDTDMDRIKIVYILSLHIFFFKQGIFNFESRIWIFRLVRRIKPAKNLADKQDKGMLDKSRFITVSCSFIRYQIVGNWFCFLDRKEKLQLKNDNYYKRDVVIITLKKKFKDIVPICVKKHTKIEAELLHNKEPLYMSG